MTCVGRETSLVCHETYFSHVVTIVYLNSYSNKETCEYTIENYLIHYC